MYGALDGTVSRVLLSATSTPFSLNQIFTVFPDPPPPKLWNCAENWILYVPGYVNVIWEPLTIFTPLASGVLFSVIAYGVVTINAI